MKSAAADAVEAPVETAAVLAMAPVAMAAAAGAPVTTMVALVHVDVETAADAAEAPVEKAAAAPVETTEVAAPVLDRAEGRAYCLESTLPPLLPPLCLPLPRTPRPP